MALARVSARGSVRIQLRRFRSLRASTNVFYSVSSVAKPKVLITNPAVPQIAYDILEKHCEVITNRELPAPSIEDICKKLKGIDALLWATGNKLTKEILNTAGPQLRVISTLSAGFDHIDVKEIKKRGILFGNTPEVVNDAVAEIAILLTLASVRRLREGRLSIENDKWAEARNWLLGPDIRGATVGIVGLGRIGATIARKIKVFDIGRIIYTGRKEKPAGKKLCAKFVSFEELTEESDIVIIACPLTEETRDMFDESVFCKMKKTAVLVNIARGGIIHQPSLIEALENEEIFAAGLDVMVPEPLPSDHKLLSLSNCILLPHMGSGTVKTRNDMAETAARNIVNGLNDEPMIGPV